MRLATATVAVALLAALAVAGCGGRGGDGARGDDPPSPGGDVTTLAEGRARLVAMVDETVPAVAGERAVTPAPSTDPVPCDDPTTFSEGYGKRLALAGDADADALVERARRHWEDRGYAVRTRDLSTRLPAVFADADGYTLSLQVVRDKGVAEVSGGTPCLPRP